MFALRNKKYWNTLLLPDGNAFEYIICKMSAILARPQCVDVYFNISELDLVGRWWVNWMADNLQKTNLVPNIKITHGLPYDQL